MVNIGIDDSYAIERMRTLILHPEFDGERYEWWMNDALISTDKDLIFCQNDTGTYQMCLKIIDDQNPIIHTFAIIVWEEQIAYSPFIAKVFDYNPAPGQFINEMPLYEEGNTYKDMVQKVQDCISGNNNTLISLGAYGGYVTFGFDHSVVNTPDKKDFAIFSNAFLANGNGLGGNSEPGIVMVSIDKNQNGIPDDEWYELAGSDYYLDSTLHNYAITYYRTPANHQPVTEKKSVISDFEYIRWEDNFGNNGFVEKNLYHTQDYWPKWLTDSTLSFAGTRLKNNCKLISDNEYIFDFLSWGYVDNQPNDSLDLISFDIDWAVDNYGKTVHLPCCDFIRVYTGLIQSCGWLGETSTELSHAEDLNLINN